MPRTEGAYAAVARSCSDPGVGGDDAGDKLGKRFKTKRLEPIRSQISPGRLPVLLQSRLGMPAAEQNP